MSDLTTGISLSVNVRDTETNFLRDILHEYDFEFVETFVDADSNLVYIDQRTLVGTTEDLDLQGSLTDVYGATLTFAKVTVFAVKNGATLAGYDLTVFAKGATGIDFIVGANTESLVVPPEGFFVWADKTGETVTGGTNDIIKVDSGANTIPYEILVIGHS